MVNLLEFAGQNLKAKDILKDSLIVQVDGNLQKEYEQTSQKDGHKYMKKVPCLKVHYQVGKGTVYKDFALNRENQNRVLSFGITDLDDLTGCTLKLDKEDVSYMGATVDGIRIADIQGLRGSNKE